MKNYAGLGLLLLATACSQQSKTVAGQAMSVPKQTKAELVAQLKDQGVFDAVQTSTIDRNFEVVKTTTDDDFFIKDNIVVSSSRKPKPRERSLLYWRYQFKGKGYREAKVDDSSLEGHTQPLKQLACDELGMGVVFDPSIEQVTRVFYYEAK
jgi:hypothetical protein